MAAASSHEHMFDEAMMPVPVTGPGERRMLEVAAAETGHLITSHTVLVHDLPAEDGELPSQFLG